MADQKGKGEQKDGLQMQKAPNFGQRFTNMVINEFTSTVGKQVTLTQEQETLAQHLFIGLDKALKDLEAKNVKDGSKKDPIVWDNVNMQKLAMDSMHRIELGLDALIPNHIHVVPYFNGKLKKYDLDLAIGYVGKDYYKRQMALDPPFDIRYELIHETDDFAPIMKDSKNPMETYTFNITNPFGRGPVVGGFGYIEYDDGKKNKLILVTKEAMDKARDLAKTPIFWKGYELGMQMVVIVRRVTDFLKVDPKKVNVSYAAVEFDESIRQIEEKANKGDFIDVKPEPEEPEKTNGPAEDTEEGAVVDAEFEEEPERSSASGPDF